MGPIERAARALCNMDSEDADEVLQMSDDGQMLRWHYEALKVRAVIKAIREPSEEMLEVGMLGKISAHPECDDGPQVHYISGNDASDNWTAMIDALLEEGA